MLCGLCKFAGVSFFPELNEIGAELANSLQKGGASPRPPYRCRRRRSIFFPFFRPSGRSPLLTFPALGASFPH